MIRQWPNGAARRPQVMWRGWVNIRSPAQCPGRRSLVPAWATASPADPTHRPAANPGWRSAEGYEAVACSSCLGLRGYATHPPFDAAVSAADLVAAETAASKGGCVA